MRLETIPLVTFFTLAILCSIQPRDFNLYLQCHTQEEIAEKLGWTQPVISGDLNDIKNGISAENYKPAPLRFADVWNFTKYIPSQNTA